MIKTNSMSKYRAVLSCMVAVLCACSAELDASRGLPEQSEQLEIKLTASAVELSRAGDDYFDEWDELGLTVVKWLDGTAQDLTGIRQENNVRFVNQAGEFVATSTAYFPDRTSKCTFYAYYPYNKVGFDRDKNTLSVAVNPNQYDAESYMRSDYMVCVKREVLPSTGKVALPFHHILSKLTINMIQGAGCTVEDLKIADILLKSFYAKAEYDAEQSAIQKLSYKSDIQVYRNFTESEGRLDGACAIVIPQTRSAGESLIYFVINNQTLAYKPTQEVVFESGKEYTFNVTVTVTNLGPSISVSTRIDDWKEGDKLTGDADEETPVKGTVTDVAGNTYDYVEIDGLYWMAANLKTTKYNDKQEIPYHEAGNEPWTKLTTPAWCYFENKPENKDRLGILYNNFAVQTGKLCPEGWRMPTQAELSELIGESDGSVEVKTLISPDWNGMNGTNETGFSAMPSGMAASHWYMTECYLWSSTVNTAAEDDTKYGYLYLAQWPWTGLNIPQIGMGIRCVKQK